MPNEVVSRYESGTTFAIEEEWGYIKIYISAETFLPDVAIHVEEDFRGKKLARRLVRRVCDLLRSHCVEPAYVYIDTDASDGFWEYVGFLPNPSLNNVKVPEYGYELRCSWTTFSAFGRL